MLSHVGNRPSVAFTVLDSFRIGKAFFGMAGICRVILDHVVVPFCIEDAGLYGAANDLFTDISSDKDTGPAVRIFFFKFLMVAPNISTGEIGEVG